AVCPGRGAAFIATHLYGGQALPDDKTARLVRYRYPALAPDGEYRLPRIGELIAADDARNRLFLLLRSQYDKEAELVRFDVPERLGAGKEEDVGDLPRCAFTGRSLGACVAPDGRHLYVVRADETFELLRVETQGMTVADRLSLGEWAFSLAISPDGNTLYATGGTKKDGMTIREIDTAGWRVRRTFPLSGSTVTRIVCGADGLLYYAHDGCWCRANPADDAPKARRIPAGQAGQVGRAGNDALLLSPDARRLYSIPVGGSKPYSLDVKELFEFGRYVVAPPDRRAVALPGVLPGEGGVGRWLDSPGVISADGKCLLMSSGHSFWLAGAGPLPEVAPELRPKR
ncbi:MAG: hypothetical protein K2V38_11565, partial [Gemmataceae bacterium]|nr:hypothetical protein [Gemmataceae bacterium]